MAADYLSVLLLLLGGFLVDIFRGGVFCFCLSEYFNVPVYLLLCARLCVRVRCVSACARVCQ